MSRDNMDVGFLLKQINIALARNADQSFKPVTFSQMRVLVFLAHQPNNTCYQKALETELDVSHPTVVGLLQRLEAKGLIATLTDEYDRRRKEICLTDAGRTVLQGASKHCKHAGASALQRHDGRRASSAVPSVAANVPKRL